MNRKKYDKLKKRCLDAEQELHSATSDLAQELEPFFKGDISVLYQHSDGFVVLPLYDDEDDGFAAPRNIGIDYVFEDISKDPNFYLT